MFVLLRSEAALTAHQVAWYPRSVLCGLASYPGNATFFEHVYACLFYLL